MEVLHEVGPRPVESVWVKVKGLNKIHSGCLLEIAKARRKRWARLSVN